MKQPKKRKTYWLTRDEDGSYCLWDTEPEYTGDGIWDSKASDYMEFCDREFEKLCPSAKLKLGGIMKIRGFRVIR